MPMGRLEIGDCGLLIAEFKRCSSLRVPDCDHHPGTGFKSAIRNPHSEIAWWDAAFAFKICIPKSAFRNRLVEAPRIELGSRSQRRGIYMLSRFSCLSGEPDKNSLHAE